MHISTNPWIWLTALGSLAIFSFLWKDNTFYRAAEHLYVGCSAGYGISQAYRNIIAQSWQPIVHNGKLDIIIPTLLGILLYTRYIRRIAWLSRWSMAFLIGIGTGISIYGIFNSQLVAQLRATIVPLYVAGNAAATRDNIILVLGVLSILAYFLFTTRTRGPLRHVTSAGRFMIMVTFGVAFGNVIMGRMALLLGVLQTIYGKWLGLM